MAQTFTQILTLFLKHRYFNDGLFKSINIGYADGTQKLLRDLEIIIKPFPGGFHLFAANPDILDSSNDSKPIQLYLTCNDPHYINYSELPMYSLREKLLYFNNLSANPDSRAESLFLQSEKFVGRNEIVQISYGKIQILQYNSENEYSFTYATGEEIAAQFITHSVEQSDTFFLSNIPEGLLLLKTNQQEEGKFYYYPKTVWKKPMGIVEIYTNSLLNHYKQNRKVEYALNFNNRETIWKYFLADPVYKKFDNLSIINKDKEQIFNSPQKQQINEDIEAWVFESKNKLPLTANNNEHLQLVDNYNRELKKGNFIINRLPTPSPEQLHWDRTNSPDIIYSHIYI